MIPTVAVGDTVFSDTYARFAANLMGDVGGALVRITAELDGELIGVTDSQRALVQSLLIDVPALIVAANYCHWVRDHVLDEITRIRNADMGIGEQWATFSGDADLTTLFRFEQHEALPATPPPDEPPPFPAALQQLHHARRHEYSLTELADDQRAARRERANRTLVAMTESRYARRRESIRETLVEARSAIVRNQTGKTDVLVQHVDALSAWAAGPHGDSR